MRRVNVAANMKLIFRQFDVSKDTRTRYLRDKVNTMRSSFFLQS
jgi:hypothetical protein